MNKPDNYLSKSIYEESDNYYTQAAMSDSSWCKKPLSQLRPIRSIDCLGRLVDRSVQEYFYLGGYIPPLEITA